MEFIKKNIKWISLTGCVLTIISLFLPFVTVSVEFLGQTSSESASFIEGDGAIVFAAVIVAGVLIFLKKEIFSLIPLGIGIAITIYDAINGLSEAKELTSLYSGIKLSYGIGFYLSLVGLILAIGCVCYSHFVLKKNLGVASNQPYAQNMQQGQGYQPYNFNQPTQPTPSYGQPFVGQNSSEINQPMGMSNSTVNTDIFNQAPVAQTNTVVEQPIMNNVEQSVPVQDFFNPGVITCPQCRATLNNEMKFCNQCGSKLN